MEQQTSHTYAEVGSRETARAAMQIASSRSREEEKRIRAECAKIGVQVAAADYGGDFVPSVMRIVERAVVTAKREGLIADTHAEEGALAGAAHEAVAQISTKALGLNVGGKIGIARWNVHVVVVLFMGVGLVHLNEVCLGMGHRAI